MLFLACVFIFLALVRLQVQADHKENHILHGKASRGRPPSATCPGRHQTVDEGSANDPGEKTQGKGHLAMTTPSSCVKGDTHPTSFCLLLGHATKGQLRHTDQPGESSQIFLCRREGGTQECNDTPQSHLLFQVLFVGLDNQTLCPCRSIPFLGRLWNVVLVDAAVVVVGETTKISINDHVWQGKKRSETKTWRERNVATKAA